MLQATPLVEQLLPTLYFLTSRFKANQTWGYLAGEIYSAINGLLQ